MEDSYVRNSTFTSNITTGKGAVELKYHSGVLTFDNVIFDSNTGLNGVCLAVEIANAEDSTASTVI